MRYEGTAKVKIDAKAKRFSKLYALMKLNGKIDYNQLVRTWNIKEQNPEFKCKRLLRTKTISDMVTEELLNIYKEQGITPDLVIQEEKELLQLAKVNNDRRITLDVLKNWRESLDLKPIKTQTTQSIEFKGDLSHLLPSSKDVKQLNDEVKQLDVEDKEVKQ